MQTKPPITEALAIADSWFPETSGYTMSLHGYDRPEHLRYSAEEFASIDPRLVEVLDLHLVYVKNRTLVLSLAYWNEPVVTLQATLGVDSENTIIHVVDSLLNYSNESDSLVRVEFTECHISTTEDNLDYVHNITLESALVARVWLDTTYPDWERRFQVGTSLGLDGRTLTRYITQIEHPAEQASMTDIDFE